MITKYVNCNSWGRQTMDSGDMLSIKDSGAVVEAKLKFVACGIIARCNNVTGTPPSQTGGALQRTFVHLIAKNAP